MQLSYEAIKAQLNAQGFDLVPIAPDMVDDVRLWPVPPHALMDSFRGALTGLAQLSRQTRQTAPLAVEPIEQAFPAAADCPDTVDLRRLLNLSGSDKAAFHDYHLAYGPLLGPRRQTALNLLEIGIGSNNVDVPSNMGRNGHPGASLRAFRDWAPQATVVGADVDRRILFSEERIVTHFVDQTDPASLAALAALYPPGWFDIVIDDGLHTPHASINTVLFALPLLKDDGMIVIEDVSVVDAPFWELAALLLGPGYECRCIAAKGAALIVIRRRPVPVLFPHSDSQP